VSLLLDALKRAEQEKLTRHAERPGPEPAAPRPAPSAAVLELQPLGGGAAGASAPRAEASGPQVAQAVFKAKSPLPAARNGRRAALIAAVVAIVLVAAGAGAYLWYTLRALAPAAPAIAAIRRPAPIAPPAATAPQPTPSSAAQAPNAAAIASPAPASQEATPKPAAARPSAADDRASATAPAAADPASPPDLGALLREAQSTPKPPPVELARTEEPAPRVPPDVQAGYGALVSGDLEAARRHYEAALAADPANLDAQLGLATAEARSGQIASAAAAYERALELDPNNPTAAAGLAALADPARPEALENALRADIARHPQSAALRLTLGDLLAGQGRWSEAQAAYFDAQRLRPGDPDIAYNLAVSLDHLGQRRPAAEFYRRALEARRTRAAQFDAAAASRRLAELSR
jgi:tetratricopeptide (TPR) repeat protein